MSEQREPVFQTRIFIERDGRVVFENLSEELLELARELDPEGTLALLCRADQAAPLAAPAFEVEQLVGEERSGDGEASGGRA